MKEPTTLVAEAASGDAAAFAELCEQLVSVDINLQFKVLETLRTAASSAFWKGAVEFVAEGTWHGHRLPAVDSDRNLRDRLALKLSDMAERIPLRSGPINAGTVDSALVEAMQSSGPRVRAEAARIAGDRQSRTCLPQVQALLADRDSAVRTSAMHAFAQIAGAEDLTPLAHALSDTEAGVRMRAREALAEAGVAAIPVIAEALKSSESLTRWEGTRALADMRETKTIPLLSQMLHDADSTVRRTAADGLARLGAHGARAILEALLHGSDESNLIYEAAHTVRLLSQDGKLAAALKPVSDALSGPEPAATAPVAAEAALRELSRL